MNEKYEEQYKKLVIQKMIGKITGLYIIDDNRYMYNVLENKTESWYVINDNEIQRLNIIDRKFLDTDLTLYKFKSNRNVFSFEQYPDHIIIGERIIEHTNDKYLYDMFYEILRMNNEV